MQMKALSLLIVLTVGQSCKTTASSGNSNLASGAGTADICYGDRQIDAANRTAFDFNATEIGFGNAYWAAIASAVAYHNSNFARPFMQRVGATAFKFYGDDGVNDTMPTQAFWADFPRGSILAFRGTAGFDDLLTDANATSFKGKAFNRNGVLEPLRIHRGFWDAVDSIWDQVLTNHILSLPNASYSLSSPQDSEKIFRIVNATFRGIMQEADIEGFNPNEQFVPQLEKLKAYGLLKQNANMTELLGVLNIWAEEALRSSEAYKAGVASHNMANYTRTINAGLERKRRNIARVFPFFNFKQYKPIWLTGHSLGAALATISAYRLMKMGVPVQGLITFGSPRAGNDVFEYFVQNSAKEDDVLVNFIRFQNNNDGVTRVPSSSGWRHIGSPAFFNSSSTLNVHVSQTPDDARLQRGLGGYPGSSSIKYYQTEDPAEMRGIWTFALEDFVNDHSMTEQYLKLIEKITFGGPAAGCH